MQIATSFDEFMAIMRNGIFNRNLKEANVFALMITTFYQLYQNETETKGTSPSIWGRIIAIFHKDYIWARTLGAIVNGTFNIANNQMHIIDNLFVYAFKVS